LVAGIIDVSEEDWMPEDWMPKEIGDLPVHPLVVHAAVVLIPLTALVAVLFLVPRFRAALRWPMVLLAAAALASTYGAVLSGRNFEETQVPEGAEGTELADVIDRHQELANQLLYIVIGFVIVVWIAAYVIRPIGETGPFPREGDDDIGEEGVTRLDGAARIVVALLVIVGAVAAGVQTYRTGEQGSKAVWNPTGDTDYSIGSLR
jgi:hypothetical protein